MHRLFVYGTLQEGCGNHRYLAGARLLRRARTRPEYTLVSLGGFPGLLDGGGTAVVGEVYAVDDRMLAAIDRLEGHPHFYERVSVRLARRLRAEGYVLRSGAKERYPLIGSGDWRSYQCGSRS